MHPFPKVNFVNSKQEKEKAYRVVLSEHRQEVRTSTMTKKYCLIAAIVGLSLIMDVIMG